MVEVDRKNQIINMDGYDAEEIQTIDDMKDCLNYYGQNDFILDDDDFENLKNGKIINASINGEYSMTLRYIKGINDDKKTIPEALSGACFHGEVWVKCPHCKSGNQMMGRQALYKYNGYSIYKCDNCEKLFKDR